jgi:hypothetical protein
MTDSDWLHSAEKESRLEFGALNAGFVQATVASWWLHSCLNLIFSMS